jgi:murein DD-endopeptidase MepM/ murein hydrolase activator NlpD
VVVRADHNFQEVSPGEWQEMAARCAQLHQTPPDILDRFRGQQIWLDHGDGLQSRYVHLSGIGEDIITGTIVSQGQIIGFVGNSGTSDGAANNQQAAHLHLEITLDGHYIGEGLSLVEVRRVLQRLFLP